MVHMDSNRLTVTGMFKVVKSILSVHRCNTRNIVAEFFLNPSVHLSTLRILLGKRIFEVWESDDFNHFTQRILSGQSSCILVPDHTPIWRFHFQLSCCSCGNNFLDKSQQGSNIPLNKAVKTILGLAAIQITECFLCVCIRSITLKRSLTFDPVRNNVSLASNSHNILPFSDPMTLSPFNEKIGSVRWNMNAVGHSCPDKRSSKLEETWFHNSWSTCTVLTIPF